MQVATSCHELLRPAACDEVPVDVFRHGKRATGAWCLGSRTKKSAGRGLALSRTVGKVATGADNERRIASDENTKDQQMAESEAKNAGQGKAR
jgi:hypothetical protein